MGISPFDIQCKEDMQLTFKYSDKSPACVKPSTLSWLLHREWGSPEWNEDIEYLSKIEPNLSRSLTLTISDKLGSKPSQILNGVEQIARPMTTVTEKIAHSKPIDLIEIWSLSNQLIEVTDEQGNDIADEIRGSQRDTMKIIRAICKVGEIPYAGFAMPRLVYFKPNVTSDIFVNYPYTGIWNDVEGNYHLEFDSLYETTIEFPDNTVILSNKEGTCKVRHHIYSDVYFYDLKFRLSE